MSTLEQRQTPSTHEVINQATPLEDYNTYESDRVLVEALRREGGDWAEQRVSEAGAFAGSAQTIRWGFEANENPPRLRTHDRFGNRVDEVEFHPSWHRAAATPGSASALHALPWREPQPGAHVARAAMFVSSQAEAGVGCPISMTYSAIPALRKQPEIAAEWEPRFTSLRYDGELRPAADKPGALCGMGMTEKQGGSDVRANTTVAAPLNGGGPGAEYELTGHKWFMSAPMCDAFLVLAQADGGLSCFLMPRFTPDGERNAIQIQRLKDKLGNRSNASSEVEFRGAWARLVGEEGRGVPTIIEMVNHTRLDCCLGAAAGMRAGVAAAIHHTAHRSAFGKLLIDQPLMRNVLADLAIESEAATIGALRLRARLRRVDRRRRGRDAVQAARQRGAQVLALQARRPARRRGARVLRRQRLRRGVGDAAPLPRVAAELDLGGLGQRPVPRRAAGDGPRARGARGVLRRGRRGRRGRARGSTPPPRSCAPSSATWRGSSRAPAGWSSGWRSCSRGRCWSASATRRSPTPSAPRASMATGAAPSARCPPAPTRPHHRAAHRVRRRRRLGGILLQ